MTDPLTRIVRSSLLMVVLFGSATASAAVRAPKATGETAAVTQARERYKAGERAFQAGDFEGALREFEAGYELVPRPGFLLNMAHSDRRLGRLRSARGLYKKYLLADPDSKQRDEVLGFINKLDSAIADEDTAASGSDGQAAAAPEPDATLDQEPIKADSAPTSIAMTAPAPEAPAPLALEVGRPARDESPSSRSLHKRWWFWTAVATVAAGATIGVIYATRASPTFHEDGTLGRVSGP